MYCREIIEKHLRPLLNAGDYVGLIKKWAEITEPDSPIYRDYQKRSKSIYWVIFSICALILGATISLGGFLSILGILGIVGSILIYR